MLEIDWSPVTSLDWVSYEREVNQTPLVQRDGLWWRPVRPWFYRPLNPLARLPASTRGPVAGQLGLVQFPALEPALANTAIRLIVAKGAASYSMDGLPAKVRHTIRNAGQKLSLRTIQDPHFLAHEGYPVYRAFQRRTGYRHLRQRIDPDRFAAWANRLIAIPGFRVVGAFCGKQLCAIALVFRFGDVLHYNSYFGDECALRNGASDLVLHGVRDAASRGSGIREVFAAGAGMPRGLDAFYLRRGFDYVDYAAIAKGNPLALALLRWCAPGTYRKLVGGVLPEGRQLASKPESVGP